MDALTYLPEQLPVYRLRVPWLGLPSGEVTYARERRAAGRSKYPITKMLLRLALDSITGPLDSHRSVTRRSYGIDRIR